MPRRKPRKPETESAAKVTVSVPRALLAELDRFAAADGRTRSNALVRLLERALADARRAG
ncbi:MAG: ribbon-helix-helix protein, CopG family [Planctomycetota bacterium]|nr:ribbon-helix-helix protein, CopG family [Planctomycetota bacterium]